MNRLIKIEKALFYFLSFAFFWQLRLVWAPVSGQFNEWASFSLYVTDFIIVAILFLWLRRNFKSVKLKLGARAGVKKFFFKSASGFLCLFLFFCVLSLFIASDRWLGFYRFIKLLEFVGLYFYVRYNFGAFYNLKRFWQWFIAGAALQSVAAVWQFLAQQSLGWNFFAESPLSPDLAGVAKIVIDGEKIVRAYGLVPHPNILACILMVAIFGLAWLWLEHFSASSFSPLQGKGRRWGWFSLFVLVLTALFFTFSRGVIIAGAVLFLGWLVYLWRGRETRQAILAVFLLFIIGYSLLAVIYWPYFSGHYDIGDFANSQSINLRVFYSQESLKMIWQKPALGAGMGNFTVALREVISLPDWQYQPAHNIYLLVAAETGSPALLAFLVFLLLTIGSAWPRRSQPEISHWLFIVGFLLVVGLFDHFLWDLQQGQILFWLMLGFLGARSSMDRAQASEA